MNGCINDIGVKNLLAASTPLEDLRTQARLNCGEKMQLLLRRVKDSFPQAQVVVTGYYPIVSVQTADNAFLRLLVKKLNNQRPEARQMTDKEMRGASRSYFSRVVQGFNRQPVGSGHQNQ